MSQLGEVTITCVLIDYGWTVLAARNMNGHSSELTSVNFRHPTTTMETEIRIYLLLLSSPSLKESSPLAPSHLKRNFTMDAAAPPLIASYPDGNDCLGQRVSKVANLPYIASDPNGDHLLQQSISTASTRSSPPDVIDWDDIDPITGLSKEYMTAIDIIDSCDYAELRRFNAPLMADQTMSIRQQIDIYYNGGESEEHRRKRKERMTGKRKSVTEKVVAIVAFWRCQSQRE